MNLFVFGLGYSALHFIERNGNEFVSISGTVRSAEKAEALASKGIQAFVWDGGNPPGVEILEAIANCDDMIISIAPNAAGDLVLKHLGKAIHNAPLLRTIVYLSTVGVYGDHDGAWVDENTPPRPTSARSKQRLLAEQEWTLLARAKGCNLHILRLAGIYGPGRNALENVRGGKARRIIKPGQVFNRIHADDIASVIGACLNRQTSNEVSVWNVTDDEPSPPQDVIAFAADMLRQEPPPEIPFEEADLSLMGRSFYSEIKRVSNSRIKQELDVALTCPTYREGLANLFQDTAQSR